MERHREGGARHVRLNEGGDGVRLEKSFHHLRFDWRLHAEHRDEISQGHGSLIEGLGGQRRNARAADLGRDRLLDLHQDHRHVVVLIGCADER